MLLVMLILHALINWLFFGLNFVSDLLFGKMTHFSAAIVFTGSALAFAFGKTFRYFGLLLIVLVTIFELWMLVYMALNNRGYGWEVIYGVPTLALVAANAFACFHFLGSHRQ